MSGGASGSTSGGCSGQWSPIQQFFAYKGRGDPLCSAYKMLCFGRGQLFQRALVGTIDGQQAASLGW